MTDEDRHADEVNIAFQMGAEWQKKQSDSAWKGIHEGAVLAMQDRIKTLEAALYEIVHINNMRDRFSSEIDNVITTVMGEKNADA
jgi:hypothetical protein